MVKISSSYSRTEELEHGDEGRTYNYWSTGIAVTGNQEMK